ncbi:MAG: Deoxyribonuclease NucA/NucB [Bacteroidetes bacterium]|jgi:hypothetical protein|nr:Deoxyribonuclease NucA/NucB [Bacteroidota bacterium]
MQADAVVYNTTAIVVHETRSVHNIQLGGASYWAQGSMPTFPMFRSLYADVWDHVDYYLNGRKSDILTYNGGGAVADMARYFNKKGLPPAGWPLKSWDEYPFASTYENSSKLRDVSMKSVNHLHNVTHGGYLGAFYRVFGLKSGDKFSIFLINDTPPVPIPNFQFEPSNQNSPDHIFPAVPIFGPSPFPVPIFR